VQDLINDSGNKWGCHTCDATTPGTKSGNWVTDHQDPTAISDGPCTRTYHS